MNVLLNLLSIGELFDIELNICEQAYDFCVRRHGENTGTIENKYLNVARIWCE